MEAPIAAAMITGGAAIVGTILSTYLAKRVREKSFDRLSGSRKAALAGHWEGSITQSGRRSRLDVDFVTTGKRIQGAGRLVSAMRPDAPTIRLTLDGGFRQDLFLLVQYENAIAAHVQFGVALFRLSSDAETLAGHYVGYGPYTEAVVWGDVALQKKGTGWTEGQR